MLEDEERKKFKKILIKFLKLIKIRNIFIPQRFFVEALTKDGFKIPEYFKVKDFVAKYEVPKNLLQH